MNVAVITGASKGLGEEFARQMAARRMNLLLVARSADRLAALAEELQQRHGVRIHTLPLDLALPGAARAVQTYLEEHNLHPTWLVNNAGFGLFDALDIQDEQRLVDMMMLNMVALVHLTRLILPQIRFARDGRIINVASTAAFQPIPFFNVYAASKVFVLHFSEGLAEELRSTDVRVTALCPGPTPTKFHEDASLPEELFSRGQDAATVVRMGLRGSDDRRMIVVCQRPVLIMLERLLPRWLVRRVTGMVARHLTRRIQLHRRAMEPKP